MDFTFTEEQETVSKLARELFERRATPERLTELENRETRHDEALWRELAAADLLGTALPEEVGGSRVSGDGFVELGVLLAEVGAGVAPVPAYATLVLGADTIARHGSPEQRQRFLPGVVAGTRVLSAGLAEPGRTDPTKPATTARRDGPNWRLEGTKELVPAAQLADTVVIPAVTDDGDAGLFLLPTDARGVEVRPVPTTNHEPHADVILDGAIVSAADRLHGPIESLHTRALVGLCAIQLGVAERALKIAAEYTTAREQFGRPIGSFQAVQQRMADAFIDVEAIRWTTWRAAWLIAQGRPLEETRRAARIAKFWAAEAGARVAATAQHVHGGIGIDTTYPLHRYFLWAKHNELTLGCATAQLARIGSTYPAEEGNR